mgnify:CR=1 FL=1
MTLIRQELGKSMLVIEQNKEITNQLSEARDNVIPYIKIMLVNTLAYQVPAHVHLTHLICP